MTPDQRDVLKRVKDGSDEQTSELINRLLATEFALQRAGLNHNMRSQRKEAR